MMSQRIRKEKNGNMSSTDFWIFELPEGWEKDTVSSTDDQDFFAPVKV